jgi:hypothetical protein
MSRQLLCHNTRALSQQRQATVVELDKQLSLSNNYQTYIVPPPPLNEMNVGDEWTPFDPIRIVKVANDPPIFLLRNFLPSNERQQLCQQARHKGMSHAQAGRQTDAARQHRLGSSLAWLSQDDSDIANFMTQLSAALFLKDDEEYNDTNLNNNNNHNNNENFYYYPENLQVVQYDPQGRFDLHHDGFNRTVTVLTYLNGVAGTWFPFCDATNNDDMPTTSLNNKEIVLKNKIPGKDGLCIVGMEQNDDTVRQSNQEDSDPHSQHTVQIQPGDAIVFYNYKHDKNYGMIWNWKSLHCGLPAVKSKWIATNWFRLEHKDDEGN